MSYTVLARRYRSATFDEVVGQNHVAQTLKKAIESKRIAHAYLFSGTRGVGKTSMARILAKALNCQNADEPTSQPCLKCQSCQAIADGEDMDVIEIDAASHTQVEKTREIIDSARYRPARSRFKVYIIDEVHMLSKQSFNALLKTLEEPPEHVKFILATTEPEKILPTILSRCQRYDFRNIPTRQIAEHLKEICKSEEINADDDALMLVAKAGAGSMRDALSLLDRLLSIGEKQLTVQTIERLLGLPRSEIIMELAQAIGQGRVKDVLGGADRLLCQGLSPDALVVSLIDHLRNLLIIRTCGADSNLVEAAALSPAELAKQAQQFDPAVLSQDIAILEELRRQMRQSQAGRAILDATLVRLAMAEQFFSIAQLLQRIEGLLPASGAAGQKKKPEQVTSAHAPASGRDADTPGARGAAPTQQPALEHEPANFVVVSEEDLPAIWKGLLETLQKHPSVHPLVAAGCLVGIDDGQAVIRYAAKDDHLPKMLARNGRKELVGQILTRVRGQATGVRFVVEPEGDSAPAGVNGQPAAAAPPVNADESPRPAPQQMPDFAQDPLIAALMSEFGAAIVKISEEV